MKCDDCLLAIEEYFDGELNEKQSQVIETHLFICINCSKAYKKLEAEQNIYKNYERNIAISPSLENAIESRLEKELGQLGRLGQKNKLAPFSWLKNLIKNILNIPSFTPVFVAASLILVTVVTTIMVMKNFSKTEVSPNPITSATPIVTPIDKAIDKEISSNVEEKTPTILEDLPTPKIGITSSKKNRSNNPAQKLIKEAESKYLAAIAILAKDSKENYKNMSPELRASFDKSLRIIDENIVQTRQAIKKNPKDPVIAQYMLAAYAKKVEVLQEIVTLDEKFGN